MKKINYFPVLSLLAGVLAATLFFSCAKNEVADPNDSIQNPVAVDPEGSEPENPGDDDQPIDLVFGITIDDGTKTQLGELVGNKYPNLWSDGDAVSINGVSSGSLSTGDGYVGTNSAQFPMRERVSQYNGNWYIGYPVGQFSSFDKGVGTVTIPTEQNYVEGTYDSRSFIMIGKSESQEVTFYPQVAMLRVTPKDGSPSLGAGAKVKSVTIAAIGGKQMSGTFTTDYTDGSLVAAGGASYIIINAPEGGVAFDKPFFFMVPEGTYTGGLRFTIVVSVGGVEKSMNFSNTSDYTASADQNAKNITAPAFVESSQTAPTLTVLTPSSIAVSWNGSNPANDKKKTWKISLYSNSACTTLAREVTIPAQAGCWKNGEVLQSSYPTCFAIGGLTAGATYYVKVTDVANDVTSPSAGVTLSGTNYSVVPMPASISSASDNVFAQNFNVLGWGPADIFVSSSEVQAGGYYPKAPRDDFSDFSTDGAEFRRFNNEMQINSTSNKFDWSETNLDGWLLNRNTFFCPGFLKVGNGGNFGYVITPPFTVAEGKVARVDVSVIAAKAHDDSIDEYALAVVPSATQESGSAGFTWPDTEDETVYKTVTVNSTAWTEAKATGLYVHNGDHIVFAAPPGSTNDATKRVFLRGLKVDVKEVYTGIDIHDETTLFNFSTYVAQEGKAGTNARVTRSFSVSSAWTPIDGYTGTLDGNNKTITGLTQPFFADLQGTVQNLTLESTISCTDKSQESTAIFAQTLEGGTLSYCNSNGSVTYTPSEAIDNGTRYVAGLVGYAKSGTISNCTNSAIVSVPDNGVSNDAIIEAAGLIARLGDGTVSSVSCSDLTNNGSVSIGMDATGSNYLYSRLGGVIAYIVNRKTENLDLPRFTNNGPVEFSGKSGRYVAIGGVAGEIHTSSKSTGSTWMNTNAVSMTSAARATYKNKDTNSDITIGGIVGIQGFALSNCTNTGTVTNAGTFTGTANDICIGGIAGNNKGKAVTNCKNETTGSIANSGKVSNSGAGNIIAIGGLVGWSGGSSSYSSTCYNKGAVLNTGNGAETTAGVRIGGLVGCASGNNNLSGTNYNQGTVTEQSATATAYVAVGGVCGFANNASTSLASAQNKSEGTITLSLASKSITNAYVGGVLGYAGAACSLSDASNAAAIDAKTTTTADMMYLGGVLGYTASANTLSNISNSGALTINNLTCSTSLYAGGLVGYNGGGVISGTAGNAATGDMSITMKSTGPSYIGGLAGYSSGTITGTNRGDVAVKKYSSYSCADSLNIGGIVGFQAANLTGCYNYGAVSNTNPVAASVNINIGGVSGCNNGCQLSACSNQSGASVGNSAVADTLAIGGLVGRSKAGSSYVSACNNNGSVSNSATVTQSKVGGLIGAAMGANTLTSTSGTYNYNNGTVTDSSSSDEIFIGGVCGYANHASTNLSYCRNQSGGTVTIQNGSPRNVYASGILAIADNRISNDVSLTLTCASNAGAINFNNLTISNIIAVGGILGQACGDNTFPAISGTDDSHRTTNSGNITFTSCSIASQLRLGGVWGWCDKTSTGTIQYCSNLGSITASSSTSLNTSYTGGNYIGGVFGGGSSYAKGKTIQNCNNTGNINFYFKGKTFLGGIISSSVIAPSNCSCNANITFSRSSYSTEADSVVGGISGLFQTGTRTFTNLSFNGTIDTTGSSSWCRTSGLIGTSNGTSTFNSCSVQGSIKAAATNPGLFFSGNNDTKRGISCSNCSVKNGTKHVYGSTTTTISSTSDLGKTIVVGGVGTSSTVSGITIN